MLSRSKDVGSLCRFFSMVCRKLCDRAGRKPEFMKTWSVRPKRRTLNEEAAELIRRCIMKNRRYKNSIVMENYGKEGIYLYTKKELDLAFLTQDSTKQHLYRRMYQKKKWQKGLPLPLKEYYLGAMGIEHQEEWDPLLLVGMVHRMSLSSLPWCASQIAGMLCLEKVELFMLMTGDDVMRLMSPIGKKGTQVLLQNIFKIEVLMKMPNTSVHPKLIPFGKVNGRYFTQEEFEVCNEHLTAYSRDYNYLVHFVVNKDFNAKENYLEFFALVSLLGNAEMNVIRKLESVFPGSGLRLIKAGYTMTHKVKHLTPEQYFDIFKMIKEVETYKNVADMEEENYLQTDLKNNMDDWWPSWILGEMFCYLYFLTVTGWLILKFL